MTMRVVVLCCDGLYQRHLVRRVAEEFNLTGVVRQNTPGAKGTLLARLARYRSPIALLRYLQARALLPAHERRAEPLRQKLFHHQGRPPAIPPDVPLHETADINAETTVEFIERHSPDIVLVNGTNLLRQPLLALAPRIRFGIINLHTGLSPYSRGGNCNLYMLLEGHPELVGVTVHHIDAGIDSGDIILSAQVPMEPGDNFESVDARTFHVGTELLIKSAHLLAAQRAERVAQWTQGKLFLRRTGYVYAPWHRLAVNRLLDNGLLTDYLAEKSMRDANVRTVGQA